MEHILDNPIWNALLSGNKHLSGGNDTVKYFAADTAPFVGLKEITAANFDNLYHQLPFNRLMVVFTPEEIAVPGQFEVVNHLDVFQMVYDGITTPAAISQELVPLEEKHIPEMLALTKLTNPGPFLQRTIDFSNYEGIFSGGKLVAMTGQRFKPFQYTEISAVCTHPEHGGKGYARQLISSQIAKILAKSDIPFLHVKTDNINAIKLYESLGLVTRRQLAINMIKKV